MNTKHPGYVIGYTFFVAAGLTALLVLVGHITSARIQENEQAVQMRAILISLGIQVDPKSSNAEIKKIFSDRADPTTIPAPVKGVQPYAIFTGYKEGGKTKDNVLGYVFPLRGSGMWGPVYGYMAVESDLVTLLGVNFYKDEETPGLGHEIRQPWFQAAFKGKRFWSPEVSKKMAAGLASASPNSIDSLLQEPGNVPSFEFTSMNKTDKTYNEVDAITGATITTTAVKIFIGGEITRFLKEMAKKGVYPKGWEQ